MGLRVRLQETCQLCDVKRLAVVAVHVLERIDDGLANVIIPEERVAYTAQPLEILEPVALPQRIRAPRCRPRLEQIHRVHPRAVAEGTQLTADARHVPRSFRRLDTALEAQLARRVQSRALL